MKYSDSIIEANRDGRCYLCGRRDGKMDRHEVFHGPYRKKSAENGMWLTLCHECHMRLHHFDTSVDRNLKRMMQKHAIDFHGWTMERFIREFGKNYL